jgi:cytoskeletal protein RodZ
MTQTIGQRLKAEREAQRLTLEKVFEATRIRVPYLQALEEDDLSIIPSPVQARGYLRNYAEYLGFDVGQTLKEMLEMSALPPSGEIIGPADASFAAQTEESKNIEAQAVPQTPEPVEGDRGNPVPEEPAIPIKPKPARRRKVEPDSTPASAEPPTRRRGRKKVETDLAPAQEAQPEWQSQVGEPVPAPGVIPLSEIAEEAAAPLASIPPLEYTPVEIPQEQTEESPELNAGDTLWQTWLSRVGSMVSARAKRRTLASKEVPLPESEAVIAPPVPAVPSQVEIQHQLHEGSTQILKEIGEELRQRRELLSLHFDEVERNTHVKSYYLEALERGALDDLPSTVQTRGMLANYATFLDLDVDALLLRFADALQARHRERNPQKPARKPGQPILANIPPVRTFIAGDMIFGVGMAILLVGFAIWGVNRVIAIQSQQEVRPTAPSISDVLLSSPDPSLFTATATFPAAVEAFPGEATVTLEIPTLNANADVQLNLVAVERTYLRVIVDGEVAFDGRVLPGNAYPFEAETQIEVLVGNGAAIRIVYDGRDLGLMGTFGQVVNNIYLDSEIVTPTGLPTLTPSVTPTPTRTATATATPQFTSTPVPSATAAP